MVAENITALGRGSRSPASCPQLRQPCSELTAPPILPVPGCVRPEPAGPHGMESAHSHPQQASPRFRVLLSEAAVPNPGSLGCSGAPVRRLSALLLPFSSTRLISRAAADRDLSHMETCLQDIALHTLQGRSHKHQHHAEEISFSLLVTHRLKALIQVTREMSVQ